MNSLLTLAKDLEQKSKAAADYRRDAESRIQRAREVCQSGTERKREENQRRHPRPRPEAVLSHEPAHERDAAHGQPDVADHRSGLRAADSVERGHSVVAGAADTENYTTIREQKSTQAMLSERNSGVQLSTCGEQRRRCVRVNPEAGQFGEDSSWMILAGK